MTRWKLMLEEYNPKVLHIKGVNNDTADALSRLDLTHKADDARVWGEKSKQLEYINVCMMNMCMLLLESEFEEDGFDDDVMMSMVEVEDPSYTLDLKLMREAQLNDKDLIKIVKNHLSSSGKNDTVYTYNTVEDVKLFHKNNQILVPQLKQQSVFDWYHTILIHPGESQMIKNIKLVFTLNGLNKQVKNLVKICHECQMCKRAGKQN